MMRIQTSPTLIDHLFSLEDQARMAVGNRNYYNICPSIPFTKFKRADRGGMKLLPILAPYLCWESSKEAASRLQQQGYLLADVGELAQFTARYPEEIAKHDAVFALDAGSRWLDTDSKLKNSDLRECVSYTGVRGWKRWFRRFRFDIPLGEDDRVLVFEKVGHWL